jgi:adenosine deaminase
METPATNVAMVQSTLDNRRDEIIGISMGGYEPSGPPEQFVEAYQLAERAGLRRTCHAAEHGPAQNVETCLDLLHCERIDHGYHVIEDERVMRRCAETRVCFTVCPTTSAHSSGWDFASHPIRTMAEHGLSIMINSDDSGTSGTDIGREYILMAEHMGFGPSDFKQFVMNGIDGAWLDESTKRQWRMEWSREIESLIARVTEDERVAV